MDFLEKIRELGIRAKKSLSLIQTEEATKQAFVIPFILALDYDVYDPTEVVPEFTADVGTKKGEKVDYAIMQDNNPIILIECKWCGVNLDKEHISQLFRYFSVTESRIGILTNGLIYRFYTDLEKPNQMDSKPFLEFNILDIQESLIPELRKLAKPHFDINKIIPCATELKYTREIKLILESQLKQPSNDFVRFFTFQVYSGRMTKNVLDQFQEITKRAFKQFISEEIEKRLKSVLDKDKNQVECEIKPNTNTDSPDILEAKSIKQRDSDDIETTEEETEGFTIIRNILGNIVEKKRIYYRDTVNYFGILLDDNNRKTICRLYFNSSQKYIILFDTEEKPKIPLKEIKDINNFADRLKNTVLNYKGK
ncbi:MAG: type I restriction enzyme HsdR N-terminal domain-containing protein [Bacteroidales bacterium]|nr:type I restriction enzyme HsdR N-terminal domain-containing protein [Bacteroidales bacterium]